MAAAKLLTERREDGVLLLTLNRPEQLNAVDRELEVLFTETLRTAALDDGVRAVVLAGAGEKAFSAGYDVKEMATWSDAEFSREVDRQGRSWWVVASFPKPLVTANRGLTMGWGAITSVSADIRIGCPETVFKFTAGPYGGAHLTWNLPQLIGWSKAKEYLMTSCRIDAAEARESGLLNRIVAPERVLAEAIEVAAAMASYPPAGIMAIKRLIQDGMARDYAARLESEKAFEAESVARTGNMSRALFSKLVDRG